MQHNVQEPAPTASNALSLNIEKAYLQITGVSQLS